MLNLWRARFLVLPLALVVACSGSVEDSPSGDGDGDGDGTGTLEEKLDGRLFVLESAEGYSLVPGTTASVSFQSGELSFSAGCNGHSAEASFQGDVLVVEGFESTTIGCEQELHEQDAWFADFFSDSPTVTLDGDRVTFQTEEATLVYLDDEAANPAPPLVGTVWEVSTLIQGEIALGGFEVVPTVTFRDDGTVAVFSGCNNGEGSYEITGSVITFSSGIGYTEAGCPSPELSDVEAHMQAIFTSGEVTYSFNRQDLAIDKGDLGVRAQQAK